MRLTYLNNNSNGFTLLEVLISMGILVMISFAIYQATVQTFKLRDTLSADGEFYNSIRLAMSLMQRDLALAYSPIVTVPLKKRPNTSTMNTQNGNYPISSSTPPPPNAQTMEMMSNNGLNQSSDFWSAAIDSNGLRPSRFQGFENKLSFISNSHNRIYRETPESEFAKVTYEVKRDDANDAIDGTYVLVKTESPNAFASPATPGFTTDNMVHSFKILQGIKKISIKYLQRDGNNTWKTLPTWDSDMQETKYLFPDIIEIELEVVGQNQANFEGHFRFKTENPINGLSPTF